MELQVSQQTASTAPQTTSDPRNLLAALLLTITVGFMGLHQIYMGRKTQGWIRFAMSLVGIVPLIGLPFALINGVWQLVDFFLVYLGRKDGAGNALIGTRRDLIASRIVFITPFVIIGLSIIISIIIVAASGTQQKG